MKAILIGLILFLLSPALVFAQEELKIEPLPRNLTPAPEINYVLPYPGILPDNPLYAIKAVRDRVVSFFISDPLKKAEFDLLQADKRLQAGLFLLRKEDPDVKLAISTISKGQNYFEEAITAGTSLKKNKAIITDLPDRLQAAARKHLEILRKEAPRIPSQDKKEFDLLVKRAERLVTATRIVQRQQ